MRTLRTSSVTAKSSEALLLLDTHIWLWEVFATGQLSSSIRARISDAAQLRRLRLSAISIWEISLLASRGKIELGPPVMPWITEAEGRSGIVFEPLSTEIAVEAGALPGGFRSDPADLIIVATARVTGAMLLTRDRRILDYGAAGNVAVLAA
jgi:PIN domain nuclease of toxin-antitoxin system